MKMGQLVGIEDDAALEEGRGDACALDGRDCARKEQEGARGRC